MRRTVVLASILVLDCAVALGCQGKPTRAKRHLVPKLELAPSGGRTLGKLAGLAVLHARKREPGPSDWLTHHPEPGQSFQAWRAHDPVLPDRAPGPGHRHYLYVQALGDLSGSRAQLVALASEYLALYFGLPVRRRPPLSLSLVPDEARRIHPRLKAPQLSSGFILEKILAPRLPGDAAAYISFTATDLWPGEGYNFVFGQASLHDRVGVWSVARYGDPDADLASFRRALRRTLKVAVHETGHMFSMRHCTRYECVMNGVNNQDEGDRAPLWLCPECLAKVLFATGQTPVPRFHRLAAFAEAHGLAREARMFRASAALVPERGK